MHTSACPRRWAANDLMGSPLSCTILDKATLATFGFSSLTARALMAASRLTSVYSSMGVGPTAFLVTSRLKVGV